MFYMSQTYNQIRAAILQQFNITNLYISSGVKTIQLVEQFQHGALNFSFSTRVTVISAQPSMYTAQLKLGKEGVV